MRMPAIHTSADHCRCEKYEFAAKGAPTRASSATSVRVTPIRSGHDRRSCARSCPPWDNVTRVAIARIRSEKPPMKRM